MAGPEHTLCSEWNPHREPGIHVLRLPVATNCMPTEIKREERERERERER